MAIPVAFLLNPSSILIMKSHSCRLSPFCEYGGFIKPAFALPLILLKESYRNMSPDKDLSSHHLVKSCLKRQEQTFEVPVQYRLVNFPVFPFFFSSSNFFSHFFIAEIRNPPVPAQISRTTEFLSSFASSANKSVICLV